MPFVLKNIDCRLAEIMKKEKSTYDGFLINNRWKQKKLRRSSDWVVIGIHTYFSSPHRFYWKICFLGIDFVFCFKREFI